MPVFSKIHYILLTLLFYFYMFYSILLILQYFYNMSASVQNNLLVFMYLTAAKLDLVIRTLHQPE